MFMSPKKLFCEKQTSLSDFTAGFFWYVPLSTCITFHTCNGLLHILAYKSRVTSRFRHLHPSVVSEKSRKWPSHQYDPPRIICLRNGWTKGIHLIETSMEYNRDNDGKYTPYEDTKSLDSKNNSNEGTHRVFIGIFRHNSSRMGVIATNSKTKPEAKEEEGVHDGLRIPTKRKVSSNGTTRHNNKGYAIHFLPSYFVTNPFKQELSCNGYHKRRHTNSSRNIRR